MQGGKWVALFWTRKLFFSETEKRKCINYIHNLMTLRFQLIKFFIKKGLCLDLNQNLLCDVQTNHLYSNRKYSYFKIKHF